MKYLFSLLIAFSIIASVQADIVLNEPEVGTAATKAKISEVKIFLDTNAIEMCYKKYGSTDVYVGEGKKFIVNVPAQTEQVFNETTKEYETVVTQAADPKYTTFMANWTDCIAAVEEQLAGMLNGTIQ